MKIGLSHMVDTATEAWEFLYDMLCVQAECGMKDSSRDGNIVGEIINANIIINDPTRFIVNSPKRKMPMRYAVGELLWYLSGNNSLEAIQAYTSAWDRMSDDGETVNSNYGHRIFKYFGFDQLEYVKKCLLKDPNSRQAVIHIRDPKDYVAEPTKDMPCTLTLQFFIRCGELHLIVNMRSNDIWTGFPYDVFNFCAIQNLLAMQLGIPVGTYIHNVGSLHLYERNYEYGEHKHESKEDSAETVG